MNSAGAKKSPDAVDANGVADLTVNNIIINQAAAQTAGKRRRSTVFRMGSGCFRDLFRLFRRSFAVGNFFHSVLALLFLLLEHTFL